MSTIDDSTEDTLTSDILVPLDRECKPIKHDGNPATIAGKLAQAREYWRDNGLFIEYFEHHAVQLSNGKIAADSPEAVPFILGMLEHDPYDGEKPCPPSLCNGEGERGGACDVDARGWPLVILVRLRAIILEGVVRGKC